MNELKFNSAVCTTIEQSQRLLERTQVCGVWKM